MAKISREQKEQIVTNLKEKFKKASSYAFTDYHGLTVVQLQELKKELRGLNAEFTVAKNTLIKRALTGSGNATIPERLKGPTAILFSLNDPLEPIKRLAVFIKKYGLPKITMGWFQNSFISNDEVIELSKIPGRNELYAQLVGNLQSPIFGVIGVLNANLRNLVCVLDQIRAKKGN